MHTNFQRLFFHLTFHSNLYFSFINRIIEFKCSNRKFKFINLSPIFFFSIATCTTTFNNTTFRLSFLLFSRGDVLVPRRGFGLFKPKNIYSNNRAIYIYIYIYPLLSRCPSNFYQRRIRSLFPCFIEKYVERVCTECNKRRCSFFSNSKASIEYLHTNSRKRNRG